MDSRFRRYDKISYQQKLRAPLAQPAMLNLKQKGGQCGAVNGMKCLTFRILYGVGQMITRILHFRNTFFVFPRYNNRMMFNTLRSRLLLSHFTVIFTVLFIVAAALYGFAAVSNIRLLAPLQRLVAIGVASRQQLIEIVRAGGDANDLEVFLAQTAVDQNVRIVITNRRSSEVIYDTSRNDPWLGLVIENVQAVRAFTNTDANVLVGRYEHPTNGRWLLYSRPFDFDRFQIVYLQREPTIFAFFRQFFLSPLLIAGVIALLLALILAIWISRSINRPLNDAVVAAEAIAQGHYDQQIEPVGPEEIERLAYSFNTMATQVQASQQAQRDFIANVSHDLKTPITSIRGWSQAMLDGVVDGPEEQAHAASVINSEAERMARMVAQLLVVARLDSGQMRLNKVQLNLGDILRDVERSLALVAQEKQVQLTVDLLPVPPIWGDPDRLMQVFTNLTENAITHTPAGGRVLLMARRHGAGAVEGIVQDTGVGIAREQLPRIFERFYQADSSRVRHDQQGSGLGLTIVKELVEAHGGVVQVHSELGQGTAFVVRLPLDESMPEVTVGR